MTQQGNAEPPAGRGLLGADDVRIVAILAAVGIYLSYRLALPFLPALTWALALAVVLGPVQQWLERRLGSPALAAVASAAAAAILALALLVLVVQQLVREAASGATYLEELLRMRDWRDMLGGFPRLAATVAWIEQWLDPVGTVGNVAEWLTGQSTSLLRGSINQIVGLVVTFYLLFYFLRDRGRFVEGLVRLSPLTESETRHVAGRLVDTIHATIFGTVTVAAVQGTLGGLMFWWLGLPAPVFWGIVMGLLAIVPILGAFVVWLPAAILLALAGEWVSAIVLAVWGGVIIATIDNLLYPVLVGSRLRLHTVATFIGAVGGILFFGPAGLFLGPSVIVVTLELMAILRQRSG
jgi:predicted PurR-regulated permease PerM